MESEKSTHQDRNKIIQSLLDEWNIYKEVLMACYGYSDPQFLEGFGFTVPTGGFFQRRKKKDEEETTPGEDDSTDTDTAAGAETDAGKIAAEDGKMKSPDSEANEQTG